MKASILITSKDRLKYFCNTWPSLKPQMEEGDELIVVEEGQDDWSSFLEATGKSFKFVRTHQEKYRGSSIAKNIGLRRCENEMVFINDPEVIHTTECLKQARRILEEDNTKFVVPGTLFAGRFEGDIKQGNPTIRHSMAPFVAGVMRERLEAIGGWDERFTMWGNEDNDLMYRLGLSGTQTLCEDGMHVFHQWHPRPPTYAMGDYNEPLLYEDKKSIVANVGKEWGRFDG